MAVKTSWHRYERNYVTVTLCTTAVKASLAIDNESVPMKLPPQPLRWLLPILLLGEQRHNGCEQFAYECYPTASRLRFEPGPFCARVQHANHSATEPSYVG